MPELRFTKTAIDNIPHPAKGQVFYRDTVQRGLGLRVGAQSKVYFVEGQLDRRTKRVTIGRADLFAPEIARKKTVTLLAEMAQGIDKTRTREVPTLGQAFDAFLDSKRDLAASTRFQYRRTLDVYLNRWKNKRIDQIRKSDVLIRHQKITAENGEVTANLTFRVLRSVYNYTAATHDDLPMNPVLILSQARAWNTERRRQGVVSRTDLPALWSALDDDTRDAQDIVRLALFTGMRRSEVLGLRWEYLDFSDRSLHLPSTKNGDPLHLPMSGFVAGLLDARRAIVGQSEWVFPGVGATGHLTETKSMINRVVMASGVRFTMHDLRRTFVTIAESLDIPHYALKRLLNHRAIGDVTGGYIVIDAERLREPMERVATKILEMAGARR